MDLLVRIMNGGIGHLALVSYNYCLTNQELTLLN